jgi:small-conductance mechanosensitive channel
MEIFGIGLEEKLFFGISLLNLIMFLVVLIIGIIVVRIAVSLLKKWMLKAKLSEILSEFATRVIRLILYVFVIGTALGFLGIEIGAAFVSISVVLGFVLGFALGDTLSNIASGFMIAITKPFKKGDYVTANGESGSVENVGISITELRTIDNKLIIIPNKSVWGSNITNFTKYDTRRVDMKMGVSYSEDLDKVIKSTLDVLKADRRVLTGPTPQVAVSEFADSSVNLVIRPWVKTSDYWNFFFDFQKAIKEKYDKEGISIPFPQMDVHLDKVD